MPAIEISRLRTKIDLLTKIYEEPVKFVKELTGFFDTYADLTFETGKTDTPHSLHPAYRTPVLFNHLIEETFINLARDKPEKTLATIDLLWQANKIEPRQLAAVLLGALPSSYSAQVLDRIKRWSTGNEDRGLVTFLHQRGTLTLRMENPDLWISALKVWSLSRDSYLKKCAILGLIPLIQDPGFNNLPLIFDLLFPMFETIDSDLNFQLESALNALGSRSEVETVHFIKQVIRTSTDENLPRFIRRNLPIFSNSSQDSIKIYLKRNLENR
jgi:hypothetical protein